MTWNQINLKKNDKFPVLPWSQKNIEIPKKEFRKIDFSQCHLFSSQFEELHNKFSIENRDKINSTVLNIKLESLDLEKTLKMRHDTCYQESFSNSHVNSIFKGLVDEEVIFKKKLPELNHSINLSKLSQNSNFPVKLSGIYFRNNKDLLSGISRPKKNLDPLVSKEVIDNIKKI